MAVLRLFALLLLAGAALAAAPAALAHSAEGSPSARELHDAYPLRPSVRTPDSAIARASAQPTPSATPSPSGGGDSSRTDIQAGMAAVVIVIGFATGFALAVRSGRRRPKVEPAPPVAEPPPPDDLGPRARRRAWTAELEWGPAEGGARFCVVAQPVEGGEPTVIAESAELQWPPAGAEAVAALTAAADDLEARLVAAGWRPLPPGEAWYARRFAWEPVAPAPAARCERGTDTERLWRERSPRDGGQPMSTEMGGAR